MPSGRLHRKDFINTTRHLISKDMSVNQVHLADMYLTKMMSITDISKETGIAKSMVRFYLLKQGVKLRTKKEALSLVRYKLGGGRRGKTFPMSAETKQKIREARLRYGATRAKGKHIHNGYIRLSVGENCGRNQHIVITEQHIGRRLQRGEVVHHINGIKTDNRIENLRLMTNVEHSRLHSLERLSKGLCYDISQESKRGEEHNKAKLTWRDVDYIRSSGKSTKELMQMFNVSQSTIKKVKSYKTWRIKNVS
jgi:transposase